MSSGTMILLKVSGIIHEFTDSFRKICYWVGIDIYYINILQIMLGLIDIM